VNKITMLIKNIWVKGVLYRFHLLDVRFMFEFLRGQSTFWYQDVFEKGFWYYNFYIKIKKGYTNE